MITFLDDAVVGVLLLASAAYAFSALGPRNLRRRVLTALSAWLARAPAALGMCREPLRRAAQRMARAAETKPQGACGGCDNCGTPVSGAATEIKVPIANIGRAPISRQD
jgi:hypothetical protein